MKLWLASVWFFAFLGLALPASANPAHVWDKNHLMRVVLTDAIDNREPTQNLGSLYQHSGSPEQRLYLFTQITNHEGKKITHLWFHKERLVAEVPLQIGSPNWRTYSSKLILPTATGPWRVMVINEEQDILLEYNFTVVAP